MIRFGIIGLGHIGKRHAAHIIANPHTALLAYCDIDNSLGGYFEDATIKYYQDIAEFISRDDLDVICVCTPNHLHQLHAVAALSHSKHVVVEKPMALSTQECDAIIDAAHAFNKKVFAVKQNRYNPPVALVKEIIQEGTLGNINMIQVNCFWNRNDYYYQQSPWRGAKLKDGGCLFTQFSHFVDILYYLNGDIESVIGGAIANFAHLHNTEFEDTGSFIMKANNGAIVNFNFTTTSYEQNMEGSITIFADKGTLKIGGQYLNTIEYQKIEGLELPNINISAKANDYGLYQGSMSNHDKVIQNVVDVLLHDANMMTSVEEGKAVIGIIEKMYAAV